MDNFLRQSSYLIFYRWCKSQLPCHYDGKSDKWANSLSYINQDHKIIISFYHNGVVEQIVTRINDDNPLYYIHFRFLDFYHGMSMFNDFLFFLNNLKQENKHILICCSCGMTSSLFAEDLQEFISHSKVRIDVSASDVNSIKNKQQHFDLIILTPQVDYYKPKLIDIIKTKIITMPTKDYACHDYAHVLSIIQNYL